MKLRLFDGHCCVAVTAIDKRAEIDRIGAAPALVYKGRYYEYKAVCNGYIDFEMCEEPVCVDSLFEGVPASALDSDPTGGQMG